MIISLSGMPGSGKTSVAKILAQKLGMAFYSMGELRAKMAMERGLTIDELNALGEKDPTTDTRVDDYQKDLGKKEDNFVIEGRLGWFFIPHSFKVFLVCDPKEAARRVMEAKKKNERPDESNHLDLEKIEEELAHRTASDVIRYRKYYGIDHRDPSHYDFVLDTTRFSGPEQTASTIIDELKKRAKI